MCRPGDSLEDGVSVLALGWWVGEEQEELEQLQEEFWLLS